MFPLAPEELGGKHILLILIPRNRSMVAQFVVGPARWTGDKLLVQYHPTQPPARAIGSREALSGCDPVRLPHFIVPEQRASVDALAAGAYAWVTSFASDALPDVLTLRMPFFGLAESGDGAALLMEEPSDSLDGAGDDDESEPGEPWRSGEQVT